MGRSNCKVLDHGPEIWPMSQLSLLARPGGAELLCSVSRTRDLAQIIAKFTGKFLGREVAVRFWITGRRTSQGQRLVYFTVRPSPSKWADRWLGPVSRAPCLSSSDSSFSDWAGMGLNMEVYGPEWVGLSGFV